MAVPFSRVRAGLLAACVVLVVSPTGASPVTQVGGYIIPLTSRLEAAFDTYESPAGTLDPIADASRGPEIYRPGLTAPVVFRDLREGSSFENSFGWYNVGDDVTTAAGRAANLHPVLGCGVPMANVAATATRHRGNPASYVQNAEETSWVSIDFNSEATAGRYKGGFIGFYLITPEDPANPPNRLTGRAFNCGDFKQDTGALSLFGFIYFTQAALTNDPDVVHHLVYRSPTADRFYFAFEDLFRDGNDDDFEDMLVRVEGIRPPCVPTAEVCDGVDNDCDGIVDTDDAGLVGLGGACLCDGVGLACDNGPVSGACQSGITVCSSGVVYCHGTVGPTTETCDARDNDCDGTPDDDACGYACPGGGTASAEICDGVDNDCDFVTDEDVIGVGAACTSSGLGRCGAGTMACVGGDMECVDGPATTEICNEIDDDCDGDPDDGDLCAGGSCTDGACVLPCLGTAPRCPTGFLCGADDLCEPDPCHGITCADDLNGNPQTCREGMCQAPACSVCPSGYTCRASDGACVRDAVTSDAGTGAGDGDDASVPDSGPADASGGEDDPSPRHSGGCSASGSGSNGDGSLVLLAIVASVLLRVGRRGRASATHPVLIAMLVVGACTTSGGGGGGGGGADDASADDASSDADAEDASAGDANAEDAALACEVLRDEICNAIDDDCDRETDEGFDLAVDHANCGACGVVCDRPGAQTACVGGECTITRCFPGYRDGNDDISAPYVDSDGCEATCFPSNGGVEVCDELDNDCDGEVDEGFDLDEDDANCGVCGRTCSFYGATGRCDDALCTFDRAVDCDAGYVDLDHATLSGCEYACTPSAGGLEICDDSDNDCNGFADDTGGDGRVDVSCYGGTAGTVDVGTCHAGSVTCDTTCSGEVVPQSTDLCGDGLDTDCDADDDAAEGCLVLDDAVRLDTTELQLGAEHSNDLVIARGGVPLGSSVYAVWTQRGGVETQVVLRKYTASSGTWGNTIVVTNTTTGDKLRPSIAVAPGANDRVVIAYQYVAPGTRVRDLRVQISTNGGATFGAASAALDGNGDVSNQRIAIRANNCVVVWEKTDTTTRDHDVQSRTSSNGCSAFNAERTINVTSGAASPRSAGQPHVGLTSSGGVVWTWQEARAGLTSDIFANAAADLTATLTSDVRVDGDTTDGLRSTRPRILVNETAAYLVWEETSTVTGGGSDVVFARSSNGGVSFTAGLVLDDPAGEVSPSLSPTFAVDGRSAGGADDVLVFAWLDRREGSQIYAAVSTNGGATVGAPGRVSSVGGAPLTHPASAPYVAAAGNGRFAVVYEVLEGTPETSQAYLATSIDTGATWTWSQRALAFSPGTAAGSNPVVASSLYETAPAFVTAWNSYSSPLGDIHAARVR